MDRHDQRKHGRVDHRHPTAGSLTTFNVVDNSFGPPDIVVGAFNVGAGTINISGTHVSSYEIGGDVTAGLLNASGYHTAAAATATSLLMFGKATAAITLTGSAGADTLTGSAFTDTISGGSGNDSITNMASGQAASACWIP